MKITVLKATFLAGAEVAYSKLSIFRSRMNERCFEWMFMKIVNKVVSQSIKWLWCIINYSIVLR